MHRNKIQDFNVGEGYEYINDFLGYTNVGHGTQIERTRLRITEELSLAMFTAVTGIKQRLYNKQFICVAKHVSSFWKKQPGGDSVAATETQMVFIYHHDFIDYLVTVKVEALGD